MDKPRCFSAATGRLDSLVAVKELAALRAFDLFASTVPYREQEYLCSFFLGSSTGLIPHAPSSSLLSLGFYKIHDPQETLDSMALILSPVYVPLFLWSRGPRTARPSLCQQ